MAAHHDETGSDDAVASHAFRQLNDALQFLCFGMFPEGFAKKPLFTPAVAVPLLELG